MTATTVAPFETNQKSFFGNMTTSSANDTFSGPLSQEKTRPPNQVGKFENLL